MASRILAIDYGSVRVGLALSDPLRILAQPIPYVENKGPKELLQTLKKIIEEKEVQLVLIGLARRKDDSLGPIGEASVLLSEELKKECGVPVELKDEAFTSREAEEFLIQELRYSREKRKGLKDSLAACLILRGYLSGIK